MSLMSSLHFGNSVVGAQSWLGASTGANLALEVAAQHVCEVDALVLLGPHSRVPVPRYIGIFSILPSWAAELWKKAALSLLDIRKPRRLEEKQYEGLVAAVRGADLRKMGASSRAWRRYRIDVETARAINVPTLVVGAASDSFHSNVAAMAVANAMPTVTYHEVSNFTALHASATGRRVADFCKSTHGER